MSEKPFDLGPLPPVPKEERRLVGLTHIPTVWEVAAPHVATLPDGSTVNLPAGTVLRESSDPNAPTLGRSCLSCGATERNVGGSCDAPWHRGAADLPPAPQKHDDRALLWKARHELCILTKEGDDCYEPLDGLMQDIAEQFGIDPDERYFAAAAPREGTREGTPEAPRESTPEENFAALKRMAPATAALHERAAAKHGVKPWDATEEMLWEECPALRPEGRTLSLEGVTQIRTMVRGIRGFKQALLDLALGFFDADGKLRAHALVYCKTCHKTHAANAGEMPCGGPGCWTVERDD